MEQNRTDISLSDTENVDYSLDLYDLAGYPIKQNN